MADNKIQMPGAFGGLMRYDEEFTSKFMISPAAVLVLIVLIVLFAVVLNVVWPVPLA